MRTERSTMRDLENLSDGVVARNAERAMDAVAPAEGPRFVAVCVHDDVDGDDRSWDEWFIEDRATGGREKVRTQELAEEFAANYNTRPNVFITRGGRLLSR